MSTTKDLTKEAPASPRTRVGGYALLARMADKGRATLAGKQGEYHYACPLDEMLFDVKGVSGDDVKKLLEAGLSNDDLVAWFKGAGVPKTAEEVTAWSDSLEAYLPYQNPEKKDWFVEACTPLGLDPAKASLFEYLETDDRLSFAKA